MAVSFRSKTSKQETITGNTTATEPASAASGDALIAFVICASAGTPSAPSGWTVPTGYAVTQGAFKCLGCYVLRGGSAPSLVFGVTGTSIYREVQIVCLTGAAALSLDAVSAAGSTGTGKAPNPPAVVAVAASSMAITAGFNWGGYTSVAAPAGYTLRTDTANATYDEIAATKSLSASGSEDPAAFGGTWDSGNNNNDLWNGFTMTFTDVTVALPSEPFMVRQAVNRAATY